MAASWPVWNNDNPLPGPPPRAWIPVVIHNSARPVPGVEAPDNSVFEAAAPTRRKGWSLGPVASLLVHAGALATGLFLFLPADDPFDIEGSSVQVEIIATQTVASNEMSDIQSDATETLVSSGGEAVAATEPETLEPVEAETTEPTPETVQPTTQDVVEAQAPTELAPDTPDALEPLQTQETPSPEPVEALEPTEPVAAEITPLLAATPLEPEALEAVQPQPTEPTEAAEPTPPVETIEAVEPVDPDAPPVPQTRTVAQRHEPTYPKPEPKKPEPRKAEPPKPRPSAGGNGGNSNADARATAPAAGQQGSGPQGNSAAVSKYPGQVLSKLRRALRYPQGGRGAAEVKVRFTVSASGAASGISVISSSGNPAFDNAAIETVRRASPFPPIPADAGRTTWQFDMPLGFVR